MTGVGWVHVRSEGEGLVALCGGRPHESISERHYVEHVQPFREDCCARLYTLICPVCSRIVEAHQKAQT